MTHNIATRQGLPADMQILLRDYPRDAWPDHPNFARSIQNWMGAHQMFRQLAEITQTDTERFLDRQIDGNVFVRRLGHFGNLLVRNLHGHHGWEDRAFFPEISAVDDRLDHGLDMLESDHVALDDILDRFTHRANRVIKLADLDPGQMQTEAAAVLENCTGIGSFLNRHLSDEEDLVVPILLHHKMRG